MRKVLYSSVCLCIIIFSLILSVKVGLAAEKRVSVTLPGFTVRLNGQVVDNLYRTYPLLVYKDMTYFPMTWHDCRFLGLETEWEPESGLKILQGKVTSSYFNYKSKHRNAVKNQAVIPSFQIIVNGKSIDNSMEEYPLLSFNNITYFPLTWRFAHDEFGWDYNWDSSAGLSINSRNPQVKKVNLPLYAWDNDVALYEGHYYYVETTGITNNVYRSHGDQMDRELVYTYEVSTNYGFNNRLTFQIRDNRLWFFYHMGGAVMGSDVYCRVNDDGKASVKERGYLDFKQTPLGTLRINHFVPPGGNNLWLVPADLNEKDGRSVGSPKLIYGWYREQEGTTQGYSPDNSTTVVGNHVFVLASAYHYENNELNSIYCLDLNTNETLKIIDCGVREFKIINKKLYYIKDSDNFLYAANLDGSGEQKLSDQRVADYQGWYGAIDGMVYYTVTAAEGHYNLYKVEPEKENILVLKEKLEEILIVNDKIVCRLAGAEDYGLKILDKFGNLILAVTDQVSDLFADDDQILFKSVSDESIKVVGTGK